MMGAFTYPLALLLLALLGVAQGQTDLQRAENLATCLGGRFPTLCRTEWLSPADRQKAALAERQENLKTCLSGKYPILCDRNRLSIEEKQEVAAAEKRENLNTCLTGRYKMLCNKLLLSQSKLPQVLEAERAENLRTCLTGRFPSLCDRSLLTPPQDEQVRTSERKASQAAKRGNSNDRPVKGYGPDGRLYTFQPGTTVEQAKAWFKRNGIVAPAKKATADSKITGGCESGHWVESVSDDGAIVKLEDGSAWEVEATDTVDSALWLPTTEIVVCDGRLINTDDNEKVSATQLRKPGPLPSAAPTDSR
jgi:hypothetical protein